MNHRRVNRFPFSHAESASLLLILLFGSLSSSLSASAATPHDSASLYRALVEVITTSNSPDQFAPWNRIGPASSRGSAVIVPGNRILTAAHVVADAVMIEVRRAGDARRYTAEVSYVCHPCDLAILKVDDQSFFADTDSLAIGKLPQLQQRVEVHGFPEGGPGLAITAGIVSRIGVDYYAHSLKQMLLVQVDAAINPGSSGGPAVSDGKLIGIAMQSHNESENVGEIIPAPVIHHFLEDVEDGRFDGFPELDISIQSSDNPALRGYLQMDDFEGGVLVTSVSRYGAASSIVSPGDVLLAIEDTAVDANGGVPIGNGIRVSMKHLVHQKQAGDELTLTLLRDGRRLRQSVRMRPSTPMVSTGRYERRPSYRVYGGLVFQRLTTRYVMAFSEPPSHFRWYFDNPRLSGSSLSGRLESWSDRREIVVISRVLATDSTREYGDFEDHIVAEVNGNPIKSLASLSQAIDDAKGRFLRITTDQGALLVLDRRYLASGTNDQIMTQYEIAKDRSLDLKGEPESSDDSAVPASAAQMR